ncbi:MAG TPA: alpha/beta hydrolase [Geminicoccus sp.]|nr:alpha/beta hydrolase [Geminicoccus sp.]
MTLYRDFTSQEEIDREYNAGAAVPDSAARVEGWVARSAATRGSLPCRLGVAYGPTRDEYLDIFPSGEPAPVHVFVHGGYWRRFTAREHSFVAPPLVAAGVAVVIVNYALCPAVTIDEIVRQVRASIAWVRRNAASFGGDPERISVSGHSAGGHLTAMALATDWPGVYDLPADTLKAGLPISGLFDLSPFPYSFLQPALQLDWGQVRRNSPIGLSPPPRARVAVAVGGAESAEFRRQSAAFAEAWAASRYLELPGCNHFTVLEELERPESQLFATLLDLARG